MYGSLMISFPRRIQFQVFGADGIWRVQKWESWHMGKLAHVTVCFAVHCIALLVRGKAGACYGLLCIGLVWSALL